MKTSYFYFFCIILICACQEDIEGIDSNKNIIHIEGQVSIQDTFEIGEDKTLVIAPGAEVTFLPGAIFIAHGDLIIEGTEEMPIKLIAENPIGDHRIITAKSGCKIFKLKHTEIIDGLITSYSTDNHFQHCTFSNSYQLAWNDAAARFWYGKILIEDCLFEWNNQGEGLLLHNVNTPVVRNCTFKKIPDAVEYIHCKNGEIIGNHFEGMNDDGIDQNHCFNTLIQDNTFYNIKDKALELGSENFGSSDSLFVLNNLFVDCRVAINVKESSFAIIKNATFYNNEISLDIYTHADSSNASRASMTNSVIFGSDLPASVNIGSEAMITKCLSDKELPQGVDNIISAFSFVDPNNGDFTIISDTLPAGTSIETLGYQK